MMKAPPGNLNEMELKLSVLERANFDLKMQLFYLNKKYNALQDKQAAIEDAGSGVDDKSNLQILLLQEENELSVQKIMELEAEIYQLKLFRDDPKVAITQDGEDADPMFSIAGARDIIEENRKRERETSIAIAEHDAALIEKLQNEVAFLQKQHNRDVAVAEGQEEKIKVDTELISFKDEKIIELLKFINELKQAVDILRQKVSRYESNASETETGLVELGDTSDLPMGEDMFKLLGEDDLRRECKALRAQLRRQMQSMAAQEKALVSVQAIVDDISTYSSGEIKRLEVELDRCLEDRERLLRKCHNLEYAMEQQQFMKGGLVPSPSGKQKNNNKSKNDNNGFDDPLYEAIHQVQMETLEKVHGSPQRGGGNPGQYYNYGGTPLGSSMNGSGGASNNKNNDSNNRSVGVGPSPSLYIYDGGQMREVDSVTADICSLDMYRQREAELLHSLQSVVARCEQLEHEREILYKS